MPTSSPRPNPPAARSASNTLRLAVILQNEGVIGVTEAAHRLGVALPSAAALLLAAVHLLAGAHLLAAVLPLAAERRAAAVSVDLCESARLHRRRSLHQVVLA